MKSEEGESWGSQREMDMRRVERIDWEFSAIKDEADTADETEI